MAFDSHAARPVRTGRTPKPTESAKPAPPAASRPAPSSPAKAAKAAKTGKGKKPAAVSGKVRGKTAVGIAVEGRELQVVKLVRSGEGIRLLHAERVRLPGPLDGGDRKASLLSGILATSDSEVEIAGLSDSPSEGPVVSAPQGSSAGADVRSAILAVLSAQCDKGTRLAVSVPEGNLTYFTFEGNFGLKGKKLETRLREEVEIRQREEVLPGMIHWFENENGSLVAVTTNGGLPLMERVLELRPYMNGSFPHFSLVDTNEISLANFVRASYDLSAIERTALLHVGRASSRILFFRGTSLIRISDPVPRGSSSPDLAEFVTKRVSLEEDQHSLGRPDLFLLSGRAREANLLEGLLTGFPESQVEYVGSDLLDTSRIAQGEAVTTEMAAAIALAWKALQEDHPRFYPTNFLPAEIVERQKSFKIAWHGFAIILAAALAATWMGLDIQKTRSELRAIQTTVRFKNENVTTGKDLESSLDNLREQIASADQALRMAGQIQGASVRWSPLLRVIAEGAQSTRKVWVSSVSATRNGYEMDARSLDPDAVSGFAGRFPDAEIVEVTPITIRGQTVYEFRLQSKGAFRSSEPAPEGDAE